MVISYYVAGNTAVGRINVLASNVEEYEKVIVLSHPSPQVKTNVIRYWIDQWGREGTTLEIIESVHGKQFLDGVINPDKKQVILSSTISNDSINITHTIDLSSYILETDNRLRRVLEHQARINKRLAKATNAFATGLSIHDELEGMYIRHMDFQKADAVAANWIDRYLPLRKNRKEKGQIKTRLFGTNTAEGAVNCVPTIIQSFASVHHVKGRAGTGKSHFMNTLKGEATANGYSVEEYICSFDPKSTDMIIIRELGLCIFDSTDPHAFSPTKEDVVIDLYEETVTSNVDEQYKREIEHTTKAYKSYMKQGIVELKKAGEEQDLIDGLYTESFTEDVMHLIRDTIEQMLNE